VSFYNRDLAAIETLDEQEQQAKIEMQLELSKLRADKEALSSELADARTKARYLETEIVRYFVLEACMGWLHLYLLCVYWVSHSGAPVICALIRVSISLSHSHILNPRQHTHLHSTKLSYLLVNLVTSLTSSLHLMLGSFGGVGKRKRLVCSGLKREDECIDAAGRGHAAGE